MKLKKQLLIVILLFNFGIVNANEWYRNLRMFQQEMPQNIDVINNNQEQVENTNDNQEYNEEELEESTIESQSTKKISSLPESEKQRIEGETLLDVEKNEKVIAEIARYESLHNVSIMHYIADDKNCVDFIYEILRYKKDVIFDEKYEASLKYIQEIYKLLDELKTKINNLKN